jgi:hypothetical protein
LFQRVGAAARDQRAGDREQDRHALHRLILGSECRNASVVAAPAVRGAPKLNKQALAAASAST